MVRKATKKRTDIVSDVLQESHGLFIDHIGNSDFNKALAALKASGKYPDNHVPPRQEVVTTGSPPRSTNAVSNKGKNNPWPAGLFYITLAACVITGLAVLSSTVHWAAFLLIIPGSILLIGMLATFQLGNDGKLKEGSVVKLIVETFKSLPLLKHFKD